MYVGYNKNAVKWKYDIAQNPFSNINVHPLYHPMGSWKIPTIILSEYDCSRILFAFFAILFFNSVIQQRSTWIWKIDCMMFNTQCDQLKSQEKNT